MNHTAIIYCQKKAAEALKNEYGFAPAKLKEIEILKADRQGFCLRFQMGGHYYASSHGHIERTDDVAGKSCNGVCSTHNDFDNIHTTSGHRNTLTRIMSCTALETRLTAF